MPKKSQLKMEAERLQNFLVGLGVIFILIAGFFYFRNKKGQEVTIPTPEEILIQEEGTVKKNGESVQAMNEEEVKKLREEIEGVLSIAGETVSLTDVSGTGVQGEAKRAFSDGKFYFKLALNGLESLEKGYYYEGWLNKDEDYLSGGRVEVLAGGQGILYYQVSVDKSDYNKVFVTLEPEDGNSAPAKAILEGQF